MRVHALAPAVLLLAASTGCALAGHPPGPPLRGPAPSASAVPGDWPTLTDASFGFSLRYPRGWTEKFDQPAGFHALASRPDMTSLLDLAGSDYWLVAQASPRDASTGCGEPSPAPPDTASTTLAGLAAKRYVIAGTRGGTTQHIIDVIAVRDGTCYTLQLVAGPAVPVDRAVGVLGEIQSSYRLR